MKKFAVAIMMAVVVLAIGIGIAGMLDRPGEHTESITIRSEYTMRPIEVKEISFEERP